MNPTRILIITDRFDPHADHVIRVLREHGEEPIRWNLDELPTNLSITLELNQDEIAETLIEKFSGRDFSFNQIRSVWTRRLNKSFHLPIDLSEQVRSFAVAELWEVCMGLWGIQHPFWVSHPDQILKASHKIRQLELARTLGFRIPNTLITDSYLTLLDFYEQHNRRIIYKTMTHSGLATVLPIDESNDTPQRVKSTPTTLLTNTQMAAFRDNNLIPGLFQAYIEKRLELRVTVVGNSAFALAIYSQENEASQVDWRKEQEKLRMIRYEMPPTLENQCIEYVHRLGLQYGAIDLILTPEGDHVFLEINPIGQYLFAELSAPEMKITDALVQLLCQSDTGYRA